MAGIQPDRQIGKQRICEEKPATILQTSFSGVPCADFGVANLRKLRDNFGEQNVSGKTRD